MSISDSAICVLRAEAHQAAGLEISSAESELGREWAAVCFFYAAYHRVRAAMLVDPIFEDAPRLAAVSPRLCMQDRTASHHQGRKGQGLGIREIVPLIYPSIHSDYVALHQASIDVRYGTGTRAPLNDLKSRCARIVTAGARGELANPIV